MKNWILKKALALLLFVTVVVGMNGVPVWAADSAGQENGIEEYAEDALFTVTMKGETKGYKTPSEFAEVWGKVQGETAVIRLRGKLDVGQITFTHSDGNQDFDHTLKLTGGDITFIIEDGAELYNSDGQCSDQLFWIEAGTFTLDGGTLYVTESSALVIGVGMNADSVSIKGAKLSGGACINVGYIDHKPDVSIASCQLTARSQAVNMSGADGMYVNDILANGFAYQCQITFRRFE